MQCLITAGSVNSAIIEVYCSSSDVSYTSTVCGITLAVFTNILLLHTLINHATATLHNTELKAMS
jgi:hypothetical protein